MALYFGADHVVWAHQIGVVSSKRLGERAQKVRRRRRNRGTEEEGEEQKGGVSATACCADMCGGAWVRMRVEVIW